MRTIAFVTLGACVSSAEKKFYPYLEDTLKVITSTIFKKSSNLNNFLFYFKIHFCIK